MQLIDDKLVYSATDLVGFLECEHLTNLERAAVAGFVARPMRPDPQLDRVAKRGEQHERQFLAELTAGDLEVEEIAWEEPGGSWADRLYASALATFQAMQRGVDVVYQATFFDGARLGRADFLRRVDRPSALGGWSYEVWDTKLARHAKASAVIQLCFYSDMLAAMQGIAPEHMYLALGGSQRETVQFRLTDYAAYYRLVRREYEEFLRARPLVYPPTTRPDPVEHCDICRWSEVCRDTRRAADDLSLVAGITARQRQALRERGVETRRGLAGADLPLEPPLGGHRDESIRRAREQARIQVEGEDAHRVLSELLPPPRDREGQIRPGHGLLMLPEPSPGDLFFDIEGDPFVMGEGLDGVDYLFGVVEPGLPDADGEPTLHSFWSIDADREVTAQAERQAFEQFMDLVADRLRADPNLHIYHYAPYEPTAMKRLMGRHGTREEEVDQLLRSGVFVDLYRAVRQGVRASVESYSIKRLEPLYGYDREVDLRDAGSSIVAFEAWLELQEGDEQPQAILDRIEAYNRDDCVSTWQLRDWLEVQRSRLQEDLGEEPPRPEPATDPLPPELTEAQAETLQLVNSLTADVPEAAAERSAEQQARWLLAQLLEWHRREEKSLWWRYFYLKNELTDEERIAETDALGRLTFDRSWPDPTPRARSTVYRFSFPPQEHKIGVGSSPHDPETGEPAGEVVLIDEERGLIDLKRGSNRPAPAPTSLIPLEYVSSTEMRQSLRRLAAWVAEHGLAEPGSHRAACELLLRSAPAFGQAIGGALARENELVDLGARRLAAELNGTYLAIQGPPGSGKSTVGAEMVVDLVRAGKKVGVTATSHKVISQLLEKVDACATAAGVSVTIGQRVGRNQSDAFDGAQRLSSNAAALDALHAGDVDVVGGTLWVWSPEDMAGSVDVLVVDEAGQMSLANALAGAQAARSLVLLGDPQQLDQPLQGVHPIGADRSALAHLLGEHRTMPPELGLFLDGTYRLHPSIARYTSEVFYGGRLRSHPGRERQQVAGVPPLHGAGLRFVPVEHSGNSSESHEEAGVVAQLVKDLLAAGPTWIDGEGQRRTLRRDDVLVITPYNAQVQAISEALLGVAVGTVDKFQGQQAPVSIYSMATSSADDAPRGMEFLYSLHRLNVATSRARCLAVVVASPALLLARCRTPRQMQLANALARLAELAEPGQHAGGEDAPEAADEPETAEEDVVPPSSGGGPGEGAKAPAATAYHARYFAHELTRRMPGDSPDRLSMSLFDAAVDLNPHQIDAALFALRSPLSKGILLADEVGLGKTIEAGLVLCQLWAERRRRLLVICPASIRKQWSLELSEKFHLPTVVLDRPAFQRAMREGSPSPFESNSIVIVSTNFASAMQEEVHAVDWDLVVIDEAHKLRNAYRPSNRMGQRLRWALDGRRKLLLTATPLQNSLLELFGLSTLIDDHIFGDRTAFQAQFGGQNGDQAELRRRLATFTKRTLRNQVLEYVRYTQRRALTQPFRPSDDEQRLYEAVSDFLARQGTFSIPERQRTLTTLVLRKLLASSSTAIAGTLETMRARLIELRELVDLEPSPEDPEQSLLARIVEDQEVEDEYLDEPQETLAAATGGTADEEEDDQLNEPSEAADAVQDEVEEPTIDLVKLGAEIGELDRYIGWAHSIREDAKSGALLTALETGFAEMAKTGAARKVVIFTESRRTQEYLAQFLDRNGYAGRVVTFSGTNSGPEATRIYEHWLAENRESGRATGSRDIDVRTALIEHFRDRAEVMVATEAAAEGINLQFCSLVVNYDLPWNPQRIEQRIGRCHRYGQQHDVVVLNFLNERNEADRRVLELLGEKFRLFDGVFGASDDVLGQIESGVDFETRVLRIYQDCRTPAEISEGFRLLQEAMDQSIRERLDETRQALLDHFDEDVHERLRMQLDNTREVLDRVGRMFWALSRYVLRDRADFDDETATFRLREPPIRGVRPGLYHLISKPDRTDQRANVPGEFVYRLSHPLGEWAVETARTLPTPAAEVAFDITNHATRLADVERLRGRSGWLTLRRLSIEAFDAEEHLLFSGLADDGTVLDQEACERLFRCDATVTSILGEHIPARLAQDAERHVAATLTRASEVSRRMFQEERDRLDRWAEDLEAGAQKALDDVKAQIRAVTRQARLATTVDEELALQKKRRDLEAQQRRQRQRIFDVEDEIRDRRDALIEQLEERMRQRSAVEDLFTVRWRVV